MDLLFVDPTEGNIQSYEHFLGPKCPWIVSVPEFSVSMITSGSSRLESSVITSGFADGNEDIHLIILLIIRLSHFALSNFMGKLELIWKRECLRPR